MDKAQAQFGGGVISPQLAEHLKRSSNEKKAAKIEFGGGAIHPKLAGHIGKN